MGSTTEFSRDELHRLVIAVLSVQPGGVGGFDAELILGTPKWSEFSAVARYLTEKAQPPRL